MSRKAEWIHGVANQSIEEFLEGLLELRQEVRCLKERMNQIDKQITSVSAAKLNGEIKGAGISDISRLLEKLEEAREDVVEKLTELLDRESLGVLLIRKHPKETARTILRARYIVGDSWKHIALIVCCYKDISYPQRIKKEALAYLSSHTNMKEIIAEAKIKRIIK